LVTPDGDYMDCILGCGQAGRACGKAEARWIGGNAQAVTDGQDVPCTLVAVPAAVLRPQNGQSLSTESAGNFLALGFPIIPGPLYDGVAADIVQDEAMRKVFI
jgi:hypothetical protein